MSYKVFSSSVLVYTMSKHIKYTREILEPLVKESTSISQVLRMLGRPVCGGIHSHITGVIKKLGIDTSHFLGQASNRGKRSVTRKTADEILTTGYTYREDVYRIRRSMLEKGAKIRCVKCNIGPEYNRLPLVLEIDHINNDWSNNTFENLQFMCPNCHAQKTTSDGAKAKFLKQINATIPSQVLSESSLVKGFPKTISKNEQLLLGLYRKKPRLTPLDVNWRTQPRPHLRKYVRPSPEELKRLVWDRPSTNLEKEYGWCDTLITKWCQMYDIPKPPRGYWNKRTSGQSHEEALLPSKPKQIMKRLTNNQVEEILILLKDSKLTLKAIGKQFNVCHQSIVEIRDNKSYKHIQRI